MQMTSPRKSAVLVTGASTGIGAACALTLADMGWHVYAGVRKPEDGQALQSRSNGQIRPVILDVTQADTIREAMAILRQEAKDTPLRGLVNNAGVAIGGPLEYLDLDELRRQFEINVVGQVAVTQAFLPLLRQGRGRIVNMSSIAGRGSLPFGGPYSASKYALESLSDALRMELAPWGLQVSLIEPGSVKTPIWQKSLVLADQLVATLSEEAKTRYSRNFDSVKAALRRSAETGVDTDEVVRAVVHALTAKTPKTRYVIGRDAKIRLLLKNLPDRVQDWLILKRFALRY